MIRHIFFILVLVAFVATNLESQNVVNFEELNLLPETYWNGSDETGSFSSKYLRFYNDFDAMYSSWMGWAYSNTTDATTNSYTNLSSASGHGANNSANYAIAFVGSNWMSNNEPIPSVIKVDTTQLPENQFGMYISLAAYTHLYMMAENYYEINNFYLRLHIEGINSLTNTSVSQDVLLADYRADTVHFALSDWTYVDMTWANNCDSLLFTLESNDTVGGYGINTPTYFCIDDFGCQPPINSTRISQLDNVVFYNTCDLVVVKYSENINKIDFYDITGKLIRTERPNSESIEIPISDLKNGMYIINIFCNGQRVSKKFVK
jgi:hypothetical protein